jgi:hypothetical protein
MQLLYITVIKTYKLFFIIFQNHFLIISEHLNYSNNYFLSNNDKTFMPNKMLNEQLSNRL